MYEFLCIISNKITALYKIHNRPIDPDGTAIKSKLIEYLRLRQNPS